MEESILKSTKEMVGIVPDDASFDLEILTNINSAFTHLKQLGVDPGSAISDDDAVWADLNLPDYQIDMVKTFVFLKAKIAFDPPGTSFHISAVENQLKEQEWRLMESATIESA